MSAESWHPVGEPAAIYLDRTVMERTQLTKADSVVQAQQVVLDYVDANLDHCYRTIASYLAQPPDVHGVRNAERVVRYLASHPLIDDGQRQKIANLFNETINLYGLNACTNKKRRIPFVTPGAVELSLPVDDQTEVR